MRIFTNLFLAMALIGTVYAKKERVGQGAMDHHYEKAVFAMGCFWCGESEFRNHDTHEPLPGIISVTSGYAGGTSPNPTYENHEGYKESVEVVFDPSQVSYGDLLKIFWHNVDFLDGGGQFCDRGFPYTSAIFYSSPAQMKEAEKTLAEIQEQFKDQPIKTELFAFTNFYKAEEYHQLYAKKNPIRYKYYRWNCGRDQRLAKIWSKGDGH